MDSSIVSRNLSIMLTDMQGFTDTSSSSSRSDIVKLIRRHNKLMIPIISFYKGNIVKTIGDAFLCTFESATDAVACALMIQVLLKEYNDRQRADSKKMLLRVVINSGDVTIEENDIFGDAVNIASRMEGLDCFPGGSIGISESTFLMMNKNEIQAERIGPKEMKGIPYPVTVYSVPLEMQKLTSIPIHLMELVEAVLEVRDSTQSPGKVEEWSKTITSFLKRGEDQHEKDVTDNTGQSKKDDAEQESVHRDLICPCCGSGYIKGTARCKKDGMSLVKPELMEPRCVKCGKSYEKGTLVCPEDEHAIVPEALRGKGSCCFQHSESVDLDKIGDYDLNIWKIIKRSFQLYFKDFEINLVSFVFVGLIIFLTASVFHATKKPVAFLFGVPLLYLFAAGYYLCCFKSMRGEKTTFLDVFRGFRYFRPLVVSGVLTAVFVGVGLMLLILPGIYLLVSYLFLLPLVLDKDMDARNAMKASRAIIKKHWFKFFFLLSAMVVLNIIAMLVTVKIKCLGIIVTFPPLICGIAVAYADVVGLSRKKY